MKTRSVRVVRSAILHANVAAEAHYQATLLAQLLQMNPRTLQRCFQKELKMTPQEWLDKCRLTEAQKLARDGMRTKEIANQLDYKQASHFCRRFGQEFGMGVKAYRAAAC